MARIEVTDPFSGAVVTVEEDSPQAKAWGAVPTGPGYDLTKALADWKVDELKAYATEHEIALGEATKKAEIAAVIAASDKAPKAPETE
ncbi:MULTISPECIES: hypothetical protein [unclassified Leucobacter]|uniref:hypothetical protein n=1 Tax=unclassified Leucobacter TaxID=2621730 RepID=UPI000621F71D|nr:hypothetical protein [Leucobacter sp. Ag1]KKI20557.1 hypothetical protein XM48_07500 [Leucobacter sp. Ag1]